MARPATTTREYRPWGFYDVLDEAPGFRVKRLCVRPGHRTSYQRHAERAEHWYVVSGRGRLTLDAADLDAGPGSSIDVPPGVAHRAANTGTADLVVIEVQTGSFLGEDDIERLADDYGRVYTGESGAAARGGPS
jgi:mannose-6-phosphate isomerase-like protein (cupin superfamily)